MAKKKEPIMIQGQDVSEMNEEQLKALHEEMTTNLKDVQGSELLERLETDLIRTAWEVAEQRLGKLEMENTSLRRDLDSKVTFEDWIKNASYKERKEQTAKLFKQLQYYPEMDDGELRLMMAGKFLYPNKSLESLLAKGDTDENLKTQAERKRKERAQIDRRRHKYEAFLHMTPEQKLTMERRRRLKDAGIKIYSLKTITNPDDPRFFKDTEREMTDEVIEMRQEMKLYEYEFGKEREAIENVFKRRLMVFHKIWSGYVRNNLRKRIEAAKKKKVATYALIKRHKKWTETKRKKDRKKFKLKLLSLDRARIKMIENRYNWKGNYLQEKFNIERMMITESYDTVIKQLKQNHSAVYVNTQQFFRDTAENDILLIISLKNELASLQNNMEKMEEEIKVMQAGITKIKGPLEESEKETRWMETFVAAISKDTKSMACHKKNNEELQKSIEAIYEECRAIEADIVEKEQGLIAAGNLKNAVNEWNKKYKHSNAFVNLMKQAYNEDKGKIERMEQTLISKGLILPRHIPLLRDLVRLKVKAYKKVHYARQKEVKAFNELIDQLDIRSHYMMIDTWPKVYKLGGVPYRKTPANLLSSRSSDKYVPSKSPANSKSALSNVVFVKPLKIKRNN